MGIQVFPSLFSLYRFKWPIVEKIIREETIKRSTESLIQYNIWTNGPLPQCCLCEKRVAMKRSSLSGPCPYNLILPALESATEQMEDLFLNINSSAVAKHLQLKNEDFYSHLLLPRADQIHCFPQCCKQWWSLRVCSNIKISITPLTDMHFIIDTDGSKHVL